MRAEPGGASVWLLLRALGSRRWVPAHGFLAADHSVSATDHSPVPLALALASALCWGKSCFQGGLLLTTESEWNAKPSFSPVFHSYLQQKPVIGDRMLKAHVHFIHRK